MIQTLPLRRFIEQLSRFRAYLAENLAAPEPLVDDGEESSAQLERRRYDEYLHRGFSPFSAW